MHVFITGTGSGIGKTMALHFLDKGHAVTGISRNKAIEESQFQFIQMDLTNEEARDHFKFPEVDEDHLVLVNNAGTLGTMDFFKKLSATDIRKTFRLNVEALMEMSLKFLKTYPNKKLTLIHIGSGAASRSIKGWSNYCASKAAVHHFNNVLNDEIQYIKSQNKVRSIVVSPGVVDTPMQEKIRSTSDKKFPDVSNFISLKENGDLVSPEEVAVKILHILSSEKELPQEIELRDYTAE